MLLDDEERYRINVFDWEKEFPGIMKAGGFDAVIGNPPYYKVSGNEDPTLFKYYKANYTCAGFKTELYALFAERAISLLKPKGLHSYIVPNSFLAGIYLRPLRSIMAECNHLNEVLMFNNVKVFADAKLDSVVYTLTRIEPNENDIILLRLVDETISASGPNVQELRLYEWKQAEGREFRVVAGALSRKTFERIRAHTIALKSIATVHLGLVLESNDLLRPEKSKKAPDPILLGRNIDRYMQAVPYNWFWYGHDPIVGGTKNQQVYMTGPRIVLQAIRNLKLIRRLVGTMTSAGVYAIGTVHNIITRDENYSPFFLLGIINSNFINSYYAAHFPEHRIKGAYIDRLPIPSINFSDAHDKARHDKMVSLVDQMLLLNKRLPEAKTDHEKTSLQRQIDATDWQIDQLVYELYGLTEEEIRIVEKG